MATTNTSSDDEVARGTSQSLPRFVAVYIANLIAAKLRSVCFGCFTATKAHAALQGAETAGASWNGACKFWRKNVMAHCFGMHG